MKIKVERKEKEKGNISYIVWFDNHFHELTGKELSDLFTEVINSVPGMVAVATEL